LNIMTVAIADGAEELLVPANSAKELRRKFVFRFDVVSECIGVSHSRHLKTGFIKFDPHLQMMPRETGILPQNKFAIVIDVVAGRQRGFGFPSKIWALTC